MELPSDGVVLHTRVKCKARSNEITCKECGAMVFWVTLLSDAIKVQCITCYTEQRLRGKGIRQAIKLLKANKKNNLLTVGTTKRTLFRQAMKTLNQENLNQITQGENNAESTDSAGKSNKRNIVGT